ncbi:MAG: 3-hydroxybutyryl-CoA dehydrogenase [Bacteroidetes bacterium]|nr:MAG: 3-hydroxybutyryl-CoA dehydrogenase [Bacteroidota bacterium]
MKADNIGKVGIIGSGAMGSGIAQVAATAGWQVCVYDASAAAMENSRAKLQKILHRLVEKGRISSEESAGIAGRISYPPELSGLAGCGLVIEAITEDAGIKKQVFQQLEPLLPPEAIVASNTSSLSITSLAAALQRPQRFLGIHFFNPAPLMKLVEIIPAVQTDAAILEQARGIIDSWGKTTVLAKDTPGFIVNKVARPFYSEALRIYEEGLADVATIDWAMTQLGGFRMGPFTLMDFIGHDVNYTVTETVFKAFYYDERYRPSFTQKRLVEAGYLGRKSGRGFYDYAEGAPRPQPHTDPAKGQQIVDRILVMLINEAADTLHYRIATKADIDLAMTRGVNYPKGLLQWADEIGPAQCAARLDALFEEYHEARYRCCPLLRKTKGFYL